MPHRNVCSHTSCLVVPLEAHNRFWLCNVVVQVWLSTTPVHNLSAQPDRLSAYVRDGTTSAGYAEEVLRAGYARWLCAGCALRLCAELSCPRLTPCPCPVSLFLPRFLSVSLSWVPVSLSLSCLSGLYKGIVEAFKGIIKTCKSL